MTSAAVIIEGRRADVMICPAPFGGGLHYLITIYGPPGELSLHPSEQTSGRTLKTAMRRAAKKARKANARDEREAAMLDDFRALVGAPPRPPEEPPAEPPLPVRPLPPDY